MLDQATYQPRLKTLFKDKIRAALKEEFGYKNDMQIPKLDKIVLNMGIGEAVNDRKKDLAKRDVPSPNVADAFIMAFAPTDTAMDIWEALGNS